MFHMDEMLLLFLAYVRSSQVRKSLCVLNVKAHQTNIVLGLCALIAWLMAHMGGIWNMG